MSIESLFPFQEISQTEVDILKELLSNQTLRKHLSRMALEDTKALLAVSAIQNLDSVIVKAHATTQGRLEVLSTLLSIGELQQPNPPTN